MQILIGCAKLMTMEAPQLSGCSVPVFQGEAEEIARQLAQYSAEELKGMLRCNMAIARENWRRYQCFDDTSTRRPAIFCYDGMVFHKIDPQTLSDEDLRYANDHLLIGSFLYGVLRPLDLINCYRLEGDVVLPGNDDKSMFEYWRPILTDWFIDRVKTDDGVLVNLASKEFCSLFDWKRVTKELEVITPNFRVEKDGKLKTIVIYAKMCRGAMTRWIIENRITNPLELREFEYEGFCWDRDYNFVLK